MNFDKVCLFLLLNNEYYFQKVISYLDEILFEDKNSKLIFCAIKNFFIEKEQKPSFFIIENLLTKELKDSEFFEQWDQIKRIKIKFNENENDYINEIDNFIEITEDKFRNKKLEDAIIESVEIIQDKKSKDKTKINQLIENALGISFNTNLGHNYNNFNDRWDNYYSKPDIYRIPTGNEKLNEVLNGGWKQKTFNLFLSSTGIGKTAVMCNLAFKPITQGKNVLYITLEISEEEIAQRIDSCILRIPIQELTIMKNEKEYKEKISLFNDTIKGWGKLKIKEFPSGSVSTNTIKRFLNDLKFKDKFIPDLIFVDYIGLMCSNKEKQADNSYVSLKRAAEELRGLAMQLKIPIVSAHQLNRTAMGSDVISLKDISDSIGIVQASDLVMGLFEAGNMSEQKLLGFKVLKTRYKSNRNLVFKLPFEKEFMSLGEHNSNLKDDIDEVISQLENI